jgi:hypothetical protein
MKNFVNAFIESVNTHNPNLLPLADRYLATENCTPAALVLMETYRLIDKINCIGTVAEDESRNTVYVSTNASEGEHEVILSARMTGENEKISEIEINIYRSRSDTGFWFAVQDMAELEEKWDMIVPEDQRASKEFLEELAIAIFDNSKDGSKYPVADTCLLMEAGGIVYENSSYAELLAPIPPTNPINPPKRIPMPFGLGPIRPNGKDIRVYTVDTTRGLVVANAWMDGYVSPYIVSDETSSCFVPIPMIDMHHKTLNANLFKDKQTCMEMLATAENTTIAKFYDGKLHYISQNIKIKTYGASTSWRPDAIVKENFM